MIGLKEGALTGKARLEMEGEDTAMVLHVSPLATPDGDGGAERPFACVEEARDAIRRMKAGGTLQGPVTVYLHDGTHYLSHTLELTGEDSGGAEHPVVYRSAPGAKARMSGGEVVTDWTKGRNGAYSARIAGSRRVRSLRVGERPAVLARYPSYDADNPRTGGWLFADWWGRPWERGNFRTAVRGLDAAGAYLEWDVRCRSEGRYTAWIAYATDAKDGSGRDLRVSVAAGDSTASALLPDSTVERGYDLRRVGELDLKAGDLTARLTNEAGGELALFCLLLSSDPAWEPASGIEVLQWWGDYRVNGLADGAELLILQAEAHDRFAGADVQVPRSEPPGKKDRIVTRRGDLPAWKRWDLVDVHLFPAWGWVNVVLPVDGVDAEASTLRISCDHDVRPGNRYFLAGSPEAMTEPGEFAHDPTEELISYLPRGDELEHEPAVAARLTTLVRITGSNIRLEGLTFCDADYTVPGGGYTPDDAAIVVSGADGGGDLVAICGCRFEHAGGYAVRLEERSRRALIERNEMHGLGGGGVLMIGDDATKPVDNRIIANTIVECGRVYKHIAAVYVTSGSRNHIAHNLIRRMPRYAISCKSSKGRSSHENVIEYNDIADTNLETNDTGAIETLGKDRVPSGNVIRYNLVRNAVGLKTTQHGEFMSPHYTWGIYLDDFSSGTLIYGNIVDGTVLGGVNLHGGKDNRIENNILLNGSERQISFSPYFNDPNDRYMSGNVAVRNIIAGPSSEFFIFGRQGVWYRDAVSECDSNLYWRTDGTDLEDPAADVTPEGSLEAWRAAGYDTHSVVADPRLTPDANGIPLPAPDSPVWALGFQPIPVDRIGPKGLEPAEGADR